MTEKIEPYCLAESPWDLRAEWPEAVVRESDPRAANPDSGAANAGNGSQRRQGSADNAPQLYQYLEMPGFSAEAETADPDSVAVAGGDSIDQGEFSDRGSDEMGNEPFFQQLLATECEKAEERGCGKGMEMGLALGREEAARQIQGERDRLLAQTVSLLEGFAAARENYLHRLEREAVSLSLSIAARILRHEAHLDPLLLTGAVRVALGQLASSTSVRLRVPAQDQPMWEEALTRMPGLPLRPKVIADPGMGLGECRMETELGSADLGLWPQLKTIEKGFFDRPADLSGSGTDNGSEDIKIAAAGNQYDESERVDFGTGELTPRGPALPASAPGGAGQ